MGLYALFDGQSCAGEPGPMAAEFCARNFHTQLLQHLSALPDQADSSAVISALEQVFRDLDDEILQKNQQIQDGCGAAVCLLVGDYIFTALLGKCSAVLCQVEDGVSKPWSFGCVCSGILDADVRQLKQRSSNHVVKDDTGLGIRHPSGLISRVSRSLGEGNWKQSPAVDAPLISCDPFVRSAELYGQDHPFVFLVSSPVMLGMTTQEQVDIAREFSLQPRAACGEIATRALNACMARLGEKVQCTVVQICFLPVENQRLSTGVEQTQAPAPKKAKLTGAATGMGIQSMRLRHILVRFSEGANQSEDSGTKGKKATRTRQEAEALLRTAISDLRKEMQGMKNPKDSTEVVKKTSAKFAVRCRELSECDTARKGGNMCGELGWMAPEQRGLYGPAFKDVTDVLLPGQLSDIAVSSMGLHLVQRMA